MEVCERIEKIKGSSLEIRKILVFESEAGKKNQRLKLK